MDVMPITMPSTVRNDRILLPRSVSHDITTISENSPQRIRYSRLKRFDGSRLAARIAGYMPKNRPTMAVIETPSETDQTSTIALKGVHRLTAMREREPEDGADDAAEASRA